MSGPHSSTAISMTSLCRIMFSELRHSSHIPSVSAHPCFHCHCFHFKPSHTPLPSFPPAGCSILEHTYSNSFNQSFFNLYTHLLVSTHQCSGHLYYQALQALVSLTALFLFLTVFQPSHGSALVHFKER